MSSLSVQISSHLLAIASPFGFAQCEIYLAKLRSHPACRPAVRLSSYPAVRLSGYPAGGCPSRRVQIKATGQRCCLSRAGRRLKAAREKLTWTLAAGCWRLVEGQTATGRLVLISRQHLEPSGYIDSNDLVCSKGCGLARAKIRARKLASCGFRLRARACGRIRIGWQH